MYFSEVAEGVVDAGLMQAMSRGAPTPFSKMVTLLSHSRVLDASHSVGLVRV